MSGGHLSEEVAEDYKSGLEFLTTNDRYGINNLTVIAKENTEHADAIAKVLEERIRTVSPVSFVLRSSSFVRRIFQIHRLFNTSNL